MAKNGNLTAADFHYEMYRRFDAAYIKGETLLEVNAGEVHKTLKASNRIPLCCNALYDLQNIGDVLLHIPSGGVGPSLMISYSLPRERGLVLEKSIYAEDVIGKESELRMKKFIELSVVHPIFRELDPIARQKKSESATRKLCDITEALADAICRVNKIRSDNKKFGTLCGVIERADLLSPEALYALHFIRIIGNTPARKVPDAYLFTPKVFAYASHAFLLLANEVVENKLIWKK